MRFPPLSVLNEAHTSTAFLLLLWQELFDDASPDTFQPRLQNIPALVEELQAVGLLASHSSAWQKHLDEIKIELKHSLEESSSLLDTLPKYRWAIEDLLTFSEARRIERQARLLAQEVPERSGFYEVNLRRALSEMPKGKSRVAIAVGNLASFATRTEHRRDTLLALANEEAFTLAPEMVVARLCSLCYAKRASYQFIAAIAGSNSDVQAVLRRFPKLLLLPKEARPTDKPAVEFFEANGDAAFVVGEVEGAGPLDAAKASLRIVRPLVDTFNFFKNAPCLTVREEVLITNPASGASERMDLADQSLRRLRPRKNARALTQRALEHLQNNQLRGRLLNALELHSLAHGSAAPRIRLVNLWSAVECLLGARYQDSIIEHAATLIAPLSAWRRVEKIVRYLAISTHEYRRAYHRKLPAHSGFDYSDQDTLNCEDLLGVLTKPDGHAHPRALSDFTGSHPLLRYRLYCAWKVLSDPALLRGELKASMQRVRWQLFRIYRARNLTVHHGEDVPAASALLDTLHYYFSILLARVLEVLQKNPAWDLDDALASLSREARYVRDRLERDPSGLCISDFIRDATNRRDQTLWPVNGKAR